MAATVFHSEASLTLAHAREIITAALAEGRRQQLQPLTVTVLDTGGHLVSMDREDGSGLLRMDIAKGKAYAALGVGLGSRTVGERNKGREAFLAGASALSEGGFIPVPGAVLVLNAKDQVIGAVGVSGDAADADEACALAGVKAAGLKAGIDPA